MADGPGRWPGTDGVERMGTAVIGVGSPLMGDDGIGLRALETLRNRYACEPHVQFVDGGTWGMRLLPVIEASERILLLDAIDWGEPGGSVVRLERAELPRFLARKLSPHQIDLKEVLAVAELRGTLPTDTVALGIQPVDVVLSDSLSAEAEAALDQLVRQAVEQLEAWGHAVAALEVSDA